MKLVKLTYKKRNASTFKEDRSILIPTHRIIDYTESGGTISVTAETQAVNATEITEHIVGSAVSPAIDDASTIELLQLTVTKRNSVKVTESISVPLSKVLFCEPINTTDETKGSTIYCQGAEAGRDIEVLIFHVEETVNELLGQNVVATELTPATMTLIANILTLTDNLGNVLPAIDLSLYLDDSNLARLVSGSLDGAGLATFTRDDSSTFTIDFAQLLSVSPYFLDFIVADWVVGTEHTITIPQATHGSTVPLVQVYELVLGNYEQLTIDKVIVTPTGDVTLSLPLVPDSRFDGRVIIK